MSLFVLFQALMTLGFMAVLNWRLALTTFVVVPAIVLLSRAMGSFTSKMAKASQDALAEANSTAEEVIKKLNYDVPH